MTAKQPPGGSSAVLGGEALAWLRKRIRDRIARGETAGTTVVLKNPTREQRQAIERLLGIPGKSGKHITVQIEDLSRIITNLGYSSLEVALEELDGPIVSRAELKARDSAAWKALLEEFYEPLTETGCEPQAVEDLFVCGVLRRAAKRNHDGARKLLASAIKVLGRLHRLQQQTKRTCRAALAAELFGDSHFLDSGQPVVTILKSLHDASECGDPEFWNRVSVDCDATTSSVIVLNLRFKKGDVAAAINLYADAGEPCRITLNAIDRGLSPDRQDVFVCENPAVLSSASRRFGPRTKPIICTEGQPSIACQTLLAHLAAAGVRIHYHGDYDWGGIRIANFLHRHCGGFNPWRYTTADYQKLEGGFSLAGTACEAIWDAQLHQAMLTRGLGIHEETMLEELLSDVALRSM